MNSSDVARKLRSIFFISMLVFSGLVIYLPVTPIIPPAEGASSWTQTTYTDFKDGKSDNVEIVGDHPNTELRLIEYEYEWREKQPKNKPESRFDHAMASFWETDKALLFGGVDNYSNRLNDTWIYDESGDSWSEKQVGISPEHRNNHAMASIPGTDKVLLFGGLGGINYLNDTWVYDLSNNTWTDMKSSKAPGIREGHAMTHVYGTDRVVLFSGKGNVTNETWVYDFNSNIWINKTTDNWPIVRSDHAMAPIYGTDKIVLYAGESNLGIHDDTWIYDFGDNNWTKITPAFPPPHKFRHTMASIYGKDKVLLYGGYDVSGECNQTWIFDYSEIKWFKITYPTKISIASQHAMTSIYGADKIAVFGGFDNYDQALLNETWVFHWTLYENGTYISKPHDTLKSSSFMYISWNATTPLGTSVSFQLRTGESQDQLGKMYFLGPGGKKNTYYTWSPEPIWDWHNGKQWIQYKAFLNTSITNSTPRLHSVTVTYNYSPYTISISPAYGSAVRVGTPKFEWDFYDTDSENQSAFQVLIDDDETFDSIKFDSGIRASSDRSWHFPEGTTYPPMPDGTWYWKVRCKDSDGSWGEFTEPKKFDIDTVKPSSELSPILKDNYFRSLDTITGTADDEGVGLESVDIKITRVDDWFNWNGSGWSLDQIWFRAEGTYLWSFDSSAVNWTSGFQYEIDSKATDKANNVETLKGGRKINIDCDQPETIVESITNNSYFNELNIIRGSSVDTGGAGIEIVDISIWRHYPYGYWNGYRWSWTECWLNASGTESWHYDTSEVQWTTDNRYTIFVRAKDFAGNIEFPGPGVEFVFDTNPPENVAISINDGAEYTNSSKVTLSLEAQDHGSGLAQMAFSPDGWTWSKWEPFNSNKTYLVLADDGEVKIEFKVKDKLGYTSEPVFDTIVLDREVPWNLSITINNGSKDTVFQKVNLKLSADDETSGIYQMAFCTDGFTWSDWENYTEEKTIILPAGLGVKTVHFKVKDWAGNEAWHVYDEIELVTPSTLPAFNDSEEVKSSSEKQKINLGYVALGVVIIIIAIIVLFIVRFKDRIIIKRALKKQEGDGTAAEAEAAYVPSVEQPSVSKVQDGPDEFKPEPAQPVSTAVIDAQVVPISKAPSEGTYLDQSKKIEDRSNKNSKF